MTFIKLSALGVVALSLSACISPTDRETTPVAVQTAEGTVTCQLYDPQRVVWDRATNRPETMSVSTADNVCRAEGVRRQGG
jgi:hypothetical protein